MCYISHGYLSDGACHAFYLEVKSSNPLWGHRANVLVHAEEFFIGLLAFSNRGSKLIFINKNLGYNQVTKIYKKTRKDVMTY